MTSERFYTYGSQTAGYRTTYGPRRADAGRRPMQRAQSGAARMPSNGGRAGAAPRGAAGKPGANRAGAPVRRGSQDSRRPSAPAPRRRPSPPRRRPRLPRQLILVFAALLAALVIFGAVKLITRAAAPGEERFVDNVFINGVCLTGLTRDEGYERIYSLRDEWLNTTYPLTFNGRTWNFSPADVNAKLDFEQELNYAWNMGHVGSRADRKAVIQGLKQVPAEFVSEPTYDKDALDAFVARLATEIDTAPQDAEVTLTDLKPVITKASVNGWKLDQDKLRESLVGLIETGQVDLQLPVDEVIPTIASEAMEMRVIAKFETDVSFRGYPSRSNVRTALNHFNLFAVDPGQTVSFNEVVGPRTEAMGFLEAPEYAGDNTEMGVGGGVCQASTTLYNAMIQSGMTIIQRNRHTMTVVYVAPSLDAAVNYGKKDLVFRNDTSHPIYIYTNVTAELATVTVYGTRPEYHYELESVVLNEEQSTKVGYQDDVDGKFVYYTTDAPVLYREGHGSCESEGWIVSYDWDTKEEVSRVQVNHDVYSAGVNVYWRGVHKPKGTETEEKKS